MMRKLPGNNNMNKKVFTFGILVIVLGIIFIPTHTVYAAWYNPFSWVSDIAEGLFKAIALLLMGLSSLVLMLCGWLLDLVINFTIVKMAANVGGTDPKSLGGAINLAWATLRDVANMCFIFVLLFAAFKAMFQTSFGGLGTTIRNIIIVALLINFSLFFSKVVIDASNIVAIGFYNSIKINQSSLSTNNGAVGPGLPVNNNDFDGISAGFMNMLGLQTFFSTDFLTTDIDFVQVLAISIMSSIFMLVLAILFLMAGVMFAARFIILIFLMILSPLALVAYIIPGQRKHFDQWKDALIDQSFFAPVYFALTWVVFKLGSTLLGALETGDSSMWAMITTNPKGVMPLIVNYVLIIGFSIAALIIAKQMAGRTAGFAAVAGGVGAVALGGAALAGRNTLGREARALSESKWLKDAAATGTGVGGMAARAGLWSAVKGSKASFDVRGLANTGVGKRFDAGKAMGIAGKAGGVGGFSKTVEKKAERKADYAKKVYGTTDAEKEEAEREAEGKKKEYEEGKPKKLYDEAKKKDEDKIRAGREAETKKAEDEMKKAKEEFETKNTSTVEYAGKKEDVEAAKAKMEATQKAHAQALEKQKAKIEETEYSEMTRIYKEQADAGLKAWKEAENAINAGAERQRAYAERLSRGLPGTRWLGRFQPNQGGEEAARRIRKQAKGKTEEEAVIEAAEKWAKKKKAEAKKAGKKEEQEEEPESEGKKEEAKKEETPPAG